MIWFFIVLIICLTIVACKVIDANKGDIQFRHYTNLVYEIRKIKDILEKEE